MRGDDADEATQVEAVRGEVVGQQLQGRGGGRVGLQVIDRLDQRPAEHQRPDAVDGGAGEIRILRIRDPARQTPAPAAVAGQQLAGKRHVGGDGPFDLALAVLHRVLAGPIVDAGEAEVRLAEESRQTLEIGLLPLGVGVVVALGAVQAQAEKGPRDAAGQPHRIGLVLVVGLDGDADEVGGRLVGPQPLGGDQFADELVVGPILRELVAEPGHEATTTVEDERPVLGADEGPRRSARRSCRR